MKKIFEIEFSNGTSIVDTLDCVKDGMDIIIPRPGLVNNWIGATLREISFRESLVQYILQVKENENVAGYSDYSMHISLEDARKELFAMRDKFFKFRIIRQITQTSDMIVE